MTDPTAWAMEEARRRNLNASELAMLAVPFDPNHLPRRAGFEIKADGIGLLDVNGHLQTLHGVPFEAALHLAPALAAIRARYAYPVVLHGEYIEQGGFEAALASFQRGQGTGAAILWDAVPLSAWHGTEHSQPLHERRLMLEAVIGGLAKAPVGLIPQHVLNEPTALTIETVAQTVIETGKEGIVVKDLDSPYVRARSAFWMKVKSNETVDVPVQGIRLDVAQRVKSIVVTLDGQPNVVGAGISELLRCSPEEFRCGRMVEIGHSGRTANGLLKGAAFRRFRDDKESAT